MSSNLVQFLTHNCVSFLFEGLKGHAVQHYHSGIIDDAACDVGRVSHGVLLVGYGSGTTSLLRYTVQW